MNDLAQSIEPRESTAPESTESGIRDILTQPSVLRSALFIIAIPTFVSAIYFGLIASDIYISETRYAIRTSDAAPGRDLLSAVLTPIGASSASEDSRIVRDYILSRDMLKELDDRLNLRQHYASKTIDRLSRLPPEASVEDFLDYYRKMIEVHTDSSSGTSLLRVRAFEPEKARDVARAITELSETLINRWSARITEDTLRFARSEVEIAENYVRRTSAAVTEFRNLSGSIDPGEETAAVLKIVTDLEAQLAGSKAELIATESFMRSDSIQVKQLKAKIAALERQIVSERTRLAGESGTDLTRLISGYQPLILDQKLAEQRYASALTSLELARAEAQRQQRYLIPFVTPELPDEALEPKRLWNILTIFFGSILVFGIGSLIWAAIYEHIE